MTTIFEQENSKLDYKSLKKAIGKSANLADLAKTCVCFANAQGGYIVIGVEDKDRLPPLGQKIEQNEINELIKKLRALTDSVAIANPQIYSHENGAEYFSIQILPSMKTIATTSDGRVYIRVGDECSPVKSEELTRLASEKGAFQWELIISKTTIEQISPENIDKFVREIKASDRVSDFIKNLSQDEILEYYRLVDNGQLTNLGLLWLGDFKQRGKLNYPLTAQYIVYDENEEKIRKVEWTHNDLNPKELLLDIEEKAIELNYSYELPNGLFRKKIRRYPKEVIREILVNAFVHKSFTISGDIFINAHQDRLEVKNPGGLPLGITKDNILHQVQRRNPHLIETFKALMLMESEGSGYDLIYEKLGQDAKEYPKIESDINYTSITIFSNIVDTEILSIVDYLSEHYQFTQKEIITLSTIARHKKISTFELSKILQLSNEDRLRDWIGKLIEKKIIITDGKTRGTMYQINPKVLSTMTQNIKPSLKTMEEHKVKALIAEDLKIHPKSKMAEIHTRFDEFTIEYIRKIVYKMVKDGIVEPFGEKKNKTYSMANKK